MMVWSLFIIGLMGLFFYNKIGSIIPMVVLPTTEIIEPMFKAIRILVLKLSKFRKPKALSLMTLIRLLVTSSFAFE